MQFDDCYPTLSREEDGLGAFSPIRGKCTWWRETPDDGDAHNSRVKPENKVVRCLCFVEGKGWGFNTSELPSDCPERFHCRYYIKQY